MTTFIKTKAATKPEQQMKARGKAVCRSIVLVLTCCLPVGRHAFNQASDRELLQKEVGRLDLKRGLLTYAFEMTLSAAHTPGGIAMVFGCEGEQSRNLPVLGPTLGDALAGIQKAASDYAWNVNDGVVNPTATGGFPPLLRTSLREFDSKDANNLNSAADLLLQAPEVREARSRLGFSEAPNEIQLGLSAMPKHGTAPPPRLLAVRCQHCSIYEVLNGLVRANGHGVWLYGERECGGLKTLRISFSD